MERRQYVAALGTAVASGLAGCGHDTDGSDGSGTPTETPPSDDPQDWKSTYRSALDDEGIQVDFLDTTDTRMVVDYVTETTTVGDFLREVETVATTYGEVVAETWDLESLEMWVLDPDIEDPQKEQLASFLARTEWALAWQNEEMSTHAYMEKVLETAERSETYYDRYADATPTPTDGNDDATTTRTPSDGDGDGTPTSTSTDDSEDGTPTSTPTDGDGDGTPTPTSTDGSEDGTPTPTAGENGTATPN